MALGPWVKSADLDTQRLSPVNIVRTIDAILDLPALSQWDANASVISGIWRKTPRRGSLPVLPMQVPVQCPCCKCGIRRLLRRDAGAVGHGLTKR